MAEKLKVFITGATGFVGSNIARRLIEQGEYETHIIYRQTSKLWRIQDILPSLHAHLVDITDKKGIARTVKKIQPDIIFHLANVGVYGGLESSPEDIMKVNLIGTINLIEAVRSLPYRCFVNTGSSSEYGPKLSKMKEDDYCEPESTYAISKLAATLYAMQEAKKNNKPIVNIRLFTPFGPYDNESRLTSYGIKQAASHEQLMLNKKSTVRDYVYIDDVVDAYMLCIKHINRVRGEILNIGSGTQVSVSEIVEIIKDVTKSKSKITWGNQAVRRFESKVWKADTKKVKQLLLWKPRVRIKEGIQKTYEWHRQNH